ncbi:DUF58 domain-containing protein [Sulfurimonas sp.]|uniref:DUF58 domain-containing protein n=1 Tax=Sulfurimonas sp. TaxID=2022749 RepID=UPI00356368BE
MRSLKTYISILKSVKNRPTKYFTLLVVSILALFLQAYMHNYNIVFIVMFFIVGVAGASSIFGMLNLYSIKIELLSYKRFFANEYSSLKFSIKNSSENTSYDLFISYNDNTKYIKSIKAHHSEVISFEEMFTRRGEANIADILLYSFFPLPHEKKYKNIKIDKTIVVFAKPEGISLFKSYYKNNSTTGELDEFEGIKKFNQGDPTSYIHWASLAKNNQLMIKDFIFEEESKKLHFDFKTINGDTEQKLSQLTLWVLECEQYAFEFTLNIKDEILDSKKMSTDEILKTIALY